MQSLPEKFLEEISKLEDKAFRQLPDVILETPPTVSVRFNSRKKQPQSFEKEVDRVPWCDKGIYLPSRPSFTLDPAMHQGRYYVQDASSMAIGVAVDHALETLAISDRPIRFLDACAAPGGKTTAAIDRLPDNAFVVANEAEAHRVNILEENLIKWGTPAYIVRGDAAVKLFPDDFFDIVAADVPCSGEGMMRKDNFAVEQWSPALVKNCVSLQRKIIGSLWDSIKPGGFLIYSTCTFNLLENEENIHYIIKELGGIPTKIPGLNEENGIIGTQGDYDFPSYRFVPGTVRGEGLFMALLQKPESLSTADRLRTGKIKGKQNTTLNRFLNGEYLFLDTDQPTAVPTEHFSLYSALSNRIKFRQAGITLGTMKGRDFIPGQSLAMSTSLNRGIFPEYEIDLPTALQYLRREAITLPQGLPKGFVLLTYEQTPLGWVKNIGSRANNLYPDVWKIRS